MTVAIMFGCRPSFGATITPAAAPTRAASPQPMASIVPTPIPTSLAEPGLPAAARRPSPSLVLLNITKMAAITIISTMTMPTVCQLRMISPSFEPDRLDRERRLGRLGQEAPVPAGAAVDDRQQAERDDQQRQWRGPLHPADDAALDAEPDEERDRHRPEQGDDPRRTAVLDLPGDEGRQHRQLALGEVGDVRGPVHQHEGQRQAGVDRAVRQAVDERLDELVDDPPSHPQVRALDLVVGLQLGCRPFSDDLADLEQVGPIGELQRQLGVLLDDHGRHPELARRRR